MSRYRIVSARVRLPQPSQMAAGMPSAARRSCDAVILSWLRRTVDVSTATLRAKVRDRCHTRSCRKSCMEATWRVVRRVASSFWHATVSHLCAGVCASKYMVLATRYQIRRTEYCSLKYLIPRYMVLNTKYLSCTQYLVLSTCSSCREYRQLPSRCFDYPSPHHYSPTIQYHRLPRRNRRRPVR
jgi:hypothetical protein